MAAQQLLEVMVRRALDPLLTPAGFVMEPQPGCVEAAPGPAGHRVVFHAETAAFARRHPRLTRGLVGLLPCVDVWVLDETGTGRMRVETTWGDEFQASARDRECATREVLCWLGPQLARADQSIGTRPGRPSHLADPFEPRA